MNTVDRARRHVPKLKDGKSQQDIHRALDLLAAFIRLHSKEGATP